MSDSANREVDKVSDSSINSAPSTPRVAPKTCSVCDEKFNLSIRKEVNCAKCNLSCCAACVKAYLLSSTNLPHCMNCKVAWSDERLRDAVSDNWIKKDYATKRRDLIFDSEKSLLPATMPEVERLRERQRNSRELNKLKPVLSSSEFLIKEIKRMIDRNEPMGNIKVAVLELQQTVERVDFFKNQTPQELGATGATTNSVGRLRTTTTEQHLESKQFVKPCPEDGCNGFLSTQYKCGLCNCKACPKCFDITVHGEHIKGKNIVPETEHVCKPENVATADLIRKETRNCPTCGTSIFRMFGCDSMFCTHCNNGFNWRTGKKVEHTHLHNPHFFEWMNRNPASRRNQPQSVQDGGCLWEGRRANVAGIRTRLNGVTHDIRTYILSVIQSVQHISDIEVNGIPTYNTPEDINRQYRIKYLMGELDMDKMKQLCLTRMMQVEFDNARRSLYEMLGQAARDIINGMDARLTQEQAIELRAQLISLLEYFNTQVLKLYNKFKRSGSFSYFTIDTGVAGYMCRKDFVAPRRRRAPKTENTQSASSSRPQPESESESDSDHSEDDYDD